MELISTVLSNLFTIENILFMNVGMFSGILVGALPGLTATMGVALLMPLTFGMDMITGILMLLGVYCGGVYGGSITAVLLKTPGTPGAAATALDGYPMAQQGKAGLALDVTLKASTFGGLFSALLLLFIAPKISKLALTFSSVEYFAMALFGLSIISSISGGNQIKGLISGLLGILIACIGTDPISGTSRFVFITNLLAGVDVIPALIGLFAVTEIINKAYSVYKGADEMHAFSNKGIKYREFFKHWPNLVRSSLIGCLVGATPGTGGATAAFLAYNEARRASKDKEQFGKGCIDGVIAPEASNNAVTGSALIPLLTLGIPGDTTTAILLGAFMMKGIAPGPLLMQEKPQIVYTIMAGFFLINIFMLIQGKFLVRIFANVTKIPVKLLIPMLISLTMLGAYSCNNSMFDVKVCLLFGVMGFIMNCLNVPLTPMVIGMVLGDIAENNMRRGLAMSGGNWRIFFTRPISLVLIMIAVASLMYPTVKYLINYFKSKRQPITE